MEIKKGYWQPIDKVPNLTEQDDRNKMLLITLERAFGTIGLATKYIRGIYNCLYDEEAFVFMLGSFVTGYCGNPGKEDFFRLPPDENRRSDIDLGIIDGFLFKEIPSKEIIIKKEVAAYLAGQISYPLIKRSLTLRDFMKRGVFRPLGTVLIDMQKETGRYVDVRIYNNIPLVIDYFRRRANEGQVVILIDKSRDMCVL